MGLHDMGRLGTQCAPERVGVDACVGGTLAGGWVRVLVRVLL